MSGGFGDSQNMDEATRQKLLEIERVAKMKQCQPIDPEVWEATSLCEEY